MPAFRSISNSSKEDYSSEEESDDEGDRDFESEGYDEEQKDMLHDAS